MRNVDSDDYVVHAQDRSVTSGASAHYKSTMSKRDWLNWRNDDDRLVNSVRIAAGSCASISVEYFCNS